MSEFEMGQDSFMLWMTIAGMLCWGACFLWMHHISEKQNRMLAELREQAQRIEDLSKTEHDLIREVHPQVGQIKAGVEEVKTTVKNTSDAVDQLKEQTPS